MNTITVKDGTKIYFKDWGMGEPVVFLHGWPLSADAWDSQMLFLANNGYRVVAPDRRGHGRSSQPWENNDYDTFASDLNELIEVLDLENVTLVGHSMGGGEVARYIGKYGTKRIKKAVLLSSVTPIMVQNDTNPKGLPMKMFDEMRRGIKADRSKFYEDFAKPFHNANRPGSNVSQGTLDHFWNLCMQGSIKSQLDCTHQFSETDFTSDLKKFDIPTLIIHGSDDQIVPIDDSAKMSAELIKGSILKIYPGAAHGICVTEANKVNADLLEFLSG